jgi:hypothetical protein
MQVLPMRSPQAFTESSTLGAVPSCTTISSSAMMCTGLKKCVPITRDGSGADAAMAFTESELVFVASTAPGATRATAAKSSCFSASFSGMASTTTSQPAKPSTEVIPCRRATAASR